MLAGAALAALAAPALAQQEPAARMPPALTAPAIEYEMWTLENGLRVIAIPDETTSTVTTSLWYDIGSKLDPEGRSGFAHLFEHILSRKTENMPYNMIYSLTADIGGTRNASNWIDRTNYYEQVPAAYLETMLWTHRERMAKVVVDEEVFETERGVVKEELRQRVLAPPYGRLQRFVLPENAYDVMPHRRPGIGSIEDLDSATLDDARAFYEAYYGPDTATLIVAGNFELAGLKALVDEYFADIPPRANPVPLAIEAREPERTSPRTVAATAPNVPLPVYGGVWKGVPVTHPDAAALEVLEAILVSGDNSRLDKALVNTGEAVQVVATVQSFREAGALGAYAIARPDRIEQAGVTLDAELERLRGEPDRRGTRRSQERDHRIDPAPPRNRARAGIRAGRGARFLGRSGFRRQAAGRHRRRDRSRRAARGARISRPAEPRHRDLYLGRGGPVFLCQSRADADFPHPAAGYRRNPAGQA